MARERCQILLSFVQERGEGLTHKFDFDQKTLLTGTFVNKTYLIDCNEDEQYPKHGSPTTYLEESQIETIGCKILVK